MKCVFAIVFFTVLVQKENDMSLVIAIAGKMVDVATESFMNNIQLFLAQPFFLPNSVLLE